MNQWILNKRYQLQKRLSHKGARHTFIAKDLATHQRVVVKVLLFSPGFQWQDHKLFERGAAALKTLSFPGIPQYLDYFDVEIGRHKGFAQVQTYIPAKSLQEHLQAGRTFSEEEIHQLALQLLEILNYLHRRQPAVIHRDIKPSNVLLRDRTDTNTEHPVGQVYLVDFDSVKTGITSNNHTMTIVGTYGYMPPEQFSGNALPSSDLYSLGATLIYAVSGKHPADLPQKDMAIDFADQVTLSARLVAWLKWMTHPNLDRRLDSASRAQQVLWDSAQWHTPGQALPPQLSGRRLTSSPQQAFPQGLSHAPLQQPTVSKIRITQTDHSQTVEILFPAKGWTLESTFSLLFFGAPISLVTTFLIRGTLLALASGQLFPSLVYIIVLLPVGALTGFVLASIFKAPLDQLQLRIEPTVITKAYRFERELHHYIAPHHKLQLVIDRDISFVRIKTTNHTLELPTENRAEREWLIYTLSRRLQIPVNYIQPPRKN